MANERISVRKIKEVLRHRFTLGLSRAQSARALGIGRTTVGEYESRFKSSGLTFPLPETLDDAALEEKLFPKSVPAGTRQVLPLEYLAKEMKRPNMTLALLWEEYKKAHPEGYQYSQFAKLYRDYQKTLSYSMRQDHKAGEKGFVDFGEGLRILDRVTNETVPTNLFVHTWGASSCLFATATRSQDSKSWIEAHVACFDYFECIPKTLVPDNLKAAVIKACRYEPDLNPIYADLAAHYGFCVLPARPRRPKDKAKVENGVLLAKRWILARLRDRVFYSLEELNSAIRILVDEFNDRPLKKLGISRRALFLELDKPNALKLPEHPFEFAQWKSVRVGVNYHIEFERHFYSVPYTLIHQELEVRATLSVVEIYKDGQRVLTHQRNYKEHGYTTKKEHMPPSHQKYLEWTPERLIHWGGSIGVATGRTVTRLLEERRHPEHGYRACLGLLSLAKRYGKARLEAACVVALELGTAKYSHVKDILVNRRDQVLRSEVSEWTSPTHAHVRGAGYYQ